MFEVEPLMARTLWECIQEIMDRFTAMQHDPDPGTLDLHGPPYGFGLKFLVAGMQLIQVGYKLSGTAMNWFGLDDLSLMSYYVIELCKRTRSREVSQSAAYAMSARLLLSVLGQLVHKVKDYAGNRGGHGKDRELWDQVGLQAECMLDVVRQDLVTVKWKAMSSCYYEWSCYPLWMWTGSRICRTNNFLWRSTRTRAVLSGRPWMLSGSS